MRKYLIALPVLRDEKGFNHPTILVKASNENDARAIAHHLKPADNIGDVKLVNY
jgi:hypothetical protein